MATTHPKASKALVDPVIEDTLSDEEMDRALAGRREEIDAKLKEAYDDRARGNHAPLEPLHVLLAQERARFEAGKG